LLARGGIDEEGMSAYVSRVNPLAALFDIRHCPDSVAGQNLNGLLNPYITTQDHLSISSRTSTEWVKAKEPIGSQWEQVSALAFGLDGGISTLPLVHGDVLLEDVTMAASLDFALRVMQPVVDLTKWHLQTRSTTSGAGDIAYGEATLWDDQGIMVASMSQQSIFRVRTSKSSL
jgi:acyl-CoA thioesterase